MQHPLAESGTCGWNPLCLGGKLQREACFTMIGSTLSKHGPGLLSKSPGRVWVGSKGTRARFGVAGVGAVVHS